MRLQHHEKWLDHNQLLIYLISKLSTQILKQMHSAELMAPNMLQLFQFQYIVIFKGGTQIPGQNEIRALDVKGSSIGFGSRMPDILMKSGHIYIQ